MTKGVLGSPYAYDHKIPTQPNAKLYHFGFDRLHLMKGNGEGIPNSRSLIPNRHRRNVVRKTKIGMTLTSA